MSGSTFAVLQNQHAVVTGASGGIGRAIALELARAGASVVAHFNQSRESAKDVVRAVEDLGTPVDTIQADFRDLTNSDELVEQAWSVFGSVDVWVNNAGVDLLTGPGTEMKYDEKLRLLLDVDVRSTLLLSRAAGNRMQAAGRGTIINIGWDQADRGMEGDSGELFATARNAIMGFTRSLAVSMAPEVRVNCVAPGWVRTAWGEQASPYWQDRVRSETLLKRWGTPEDIARMVRFLASSEAGWITGQVINVNGGAVR